LIPGLDVGSPQGVITAPQWKEIRLTHLWAYLRCMQGLERSIDPEYRSNLDGSRGAPMIGVGGYFPYIPGEDPVAQATAWFNACGGLGSHTGELPPAVDFELASKVMTPAEELAALVVVIRTMELLWGRAIVLYTYPDFWKRIIAIATPEELEVIGRCLLWFASYEALPPQPPHPFQAVTFWQSSGGTGYHVPAGDPCDADFFLGTEGELEALASFEASIGPNPLAGIPVPGLEIPGENE
jgi:GH25 family lysozyme M1 (1,4-beta-N-acetylmuramidase)